MGFLHFIKPLIRFSKWRSASFKSKSEQPKIGLEQLEPRLLLSAVCEMGAEAAPLAAAQAASSGASDLVVDFTGSDSTEDAALWVQGRAVSPIFQIKLATDDSEEQADDKQVNLAEVEQGDTSKRPLSELAAQQGIVLLVTADFPAVDEWESLYAELKESKQTGPCEHETIVEQLTETLRAPHGPPVDDSVWSSVGDVGSGDYDVVRVTGQAELDLTLRLAQEDQSILQVIDNDSGDLLAGVRARDLAAIVVVGADYVDETLTVDMTGAGWGGLEVDFVAGQGGYDKLVLRGGADMSADYAGPCNDGGRVVVRGEGGAETIVAFTGLEPFVYLEGFGHVGNEGFFSYGNSPEILNVGTFSQDSDATLEIEIGGYSPGPGVPTDDGYDQINVSGQASLDGTLQVSLINDFVPVLGDTFDFLTFGTLSGSFAEVTGPFGFGGGNLYFEVVEQPDRLQLAVAEIPTGQALHVSTAATTRMEEGIQALADYSDRLLSDLLLSKPELTSQALAGTGASVDELFGLTEYLDRCSSWGPMRGSRWASSWNTCGAGGWTA